MPRRALIVAGYPDPSWTGSAAILRCGEAVRETLFGMVAAASDATPAKWIRQMRGLGERAR